MFPRERQAVRVNGDGASTDSDEMCERRLSLGVNISVLVILTIFGVMLSLPLRLLFYTNYYTQEQAAYRSEASPVVEECRSLPEVIVIPVDHRKLRRCPKFQYEDQMKSVFHSYYDRNCTYVRVYAIDAEPLEEKESEVKEEPVTPEKETTEEAQESKDIVGHILVTMLLASAITALVEVLRIRFAKDKVPLPVEADALTNDNL